jgi:hypothetical protein
MLQVEYGQTLLDLLGECFKSKISNQIDRMSIYACTFQQYPIARFMVLFVTLEPKTCHASYP